MHRRKKASPSGEVLVLLGPEKNFFNTYQPLKINRGGFGSGKTIDGLLIASEDTIVSSTVGRIP